MENIESHVLAFGASGMFAGLATKTIADASFAALCRMQRERRQLVTMAQQRRLESLTSAATHPCQADETDSR